MKLTDRSPAVRSYEKHLIHVNNLLHLLFLQVRNYTETGYLKIRAPEAVFSLVKEFWEKNKGSQKVEYSHSSAYHNTWDAPPTFVCINNASLIGGGPHLYTAIADATRDAMEVRTCCVYVCVIFR